MSDYYEWMRKLALDVYNCSPNADHPKCPECGSRMNFHGHDESGDFAYGQGYWDCPKCNWAVTEDDIR